MTTENRIKLENDSTTLVNCGEWLKVCEDNYDTLLQQALPRRSEEFYGNQPTWLMDEPPIDKPKGQELGLFDLLAWYSPLHFHKPDSYGIHLPSYGIVQLAETLLPRLPKEVSLSRKEMLYWAAHILYLHELGHAFIERLVYAMEPICAMERIDPEENFYEKTSKKYRNLIVMEEALCNTFVCGMHRKMISSFKGDFSCLYKHSDILHKVLIKFMRGQPQGYRDFKEIAVEPQHSHIFIINCKALLKYVYGIDDTTLELGMIEILQYAEAYMYIVEKSLSDTNIFTFEYLENNNEEFNFPLDEIKSYLFPWNTPIYFLDDTATSDNTNSDPAWLISSYDLINKPYQKDWKITGTNGETLLTVINSENGLEKLKEDFISSDKVFEGSLVCQYKELTTLDGFPKRIKGNFICNNTLVKSLENGPMSIKGHFCVRNAYLKSLKGIGENYLKEINGIADFRGNPINSAVLGLLKIKNIKKVILDQKEVTKKINEHLKIERDLIDCQEELIEKGYKEFAKQ